MDCYSDSTALRDLGNSVFDGVFHDRLKKQVGDFCIGEIVRHFDAELKPIRKTNLLDIEILLQKIYFFF